MVMIPVHPVMHIIQQSSFLAGNPAVRRRKFFELPNLIPFLLQRLPFVSRQLPPSVPIPTLLPCPGRSCKDKQGESED